VLERWHSRDNDYIRKQPCSHSTDSLPAPSSQGHSFLFLFGTVQWLSPFLAVLPVGHVTEMSLWSQMLFKLEILSPPVFSSTKREAQSEDNLLQIPGIPLKNHDSKTVEKLASFEKFCQGGKEEARTGGFDSSWEHRGTHVAWINLVCYTIHCVNFIHRTAHELWKYWLKLHSFFFFFLSWRTPSNHWTKRVVNVWLIS